MKRRKHNELVNDAIMRERAEGARKLHLQSVASGAQLQDAREDLKRSQQSAWDLHERYKKLEGERDRLKEEVEELRECDDNERDELEAAKRNAVDVGERYLHEAARLSAILAEREKSLVDLKKHNSVAQVKSRLYALFNALARHAGRLDTLEKSIDRLVLKFDSFVKALNERAPQPQGSNHDSPTRSTKKSPGGRTRSDGGGNRGSAGVPRVVAGPRQTKQLPGGAQRESRRRRGRPRKSAG